jgi:acetylornithine deacetylase
MNALAYARDLIRFESTSVLSNIDISRYVEQALRDSGFETEWIEYRDDAGVPKANVVGKKGTGVGGFAYFGHTDVVPADKWFSDTHGPYDPVEVEGRLYGRGSCDMKGSVSCMLAAAARYSASDLKQPVYIVCTADEETGYVGAHHVATRSRYYREMLDHDSWGVIGEPTQLQVVYSHKGAFGFVATSHGRAAHSSTRFGINANLAMIPFLQEMKAIHDQCESDEAWHDHRFEPPTVSWNIGINDFTRAINITAPQSVCTVYFRPMPGQDAEILVRRAEEAAARHGIELLVTRRCPSFYIDPAAPYVQMMLALAEQSQPQTVCYGTDGCVFAELNNLVVFGPGDIAQAHTHDEWIDLQQLELGTEMYGRCIRRFCCEAKPRTPGTA